MKKELEYFRIGSAYGGSQAWFTDYMMRMGGCAAAAACDSCIYFEQYRGKQGLYPYNKVNITKEDYIKFAMVMKPYLRPRLSGIDTLDLYMKGFSQYMADYGSRGIIMEPFYGSEPVEKAREVLQQQINEGFPVPCLILHHKNRTFKNYDWHWFMLTGYESYEDTCMVKAVTYGGFRWLDFGELWDTGYRRKGGLIIYKEK